jgi:alpha-glucosidase
MDTKQFFWWQTGVIYEIYPRSFKDSNGDGVGDLNGIIEKLDYLRWLGVDALWICPFYPSPMSDLGYDISDYKGVHKLFGSMEDFDRLLDEAHKREFKVIIDFVPNHSSDQHPWFVESRASDQGPKADWYLWKGGNAENNPPTNWLSVFGGSAWEWDETRKEYYYHAFLKEQPDLNLRNTEVQESIFDTMRFWLRKGVDGFRVDVMWHLYKDALWRDNPENPDYKKGQPEYDRLLPFYTTDHADTIEFVTKLRSVMDEFRERVMIGEMYLSVHQTVAYYGPNNSGAHLPGNFTLLLLPWKARKIAVAIDECESSTPMGAWPNWVLGNHDRPRLATRAGKDQLRVAAMLLLTLRGTPTLYYGDEIGMDNVRIPGSEIQDPQGRLMGLNRDEYRAPMQWNAAKNAGFTTADKPWLRMASDYTEVNVELQKQDEHSLLNLYRELLTLRRSEEALQIGDYIPVQASGDMLAYVRVHKDRRLLVALNLGRKAHTVKSTRFSLEGVILAHTHMKRRGEAVKKRIRLEGGEGVIVELSAPGQNGSAR